MTESNDASRYIETPSGKIAYMEAGAGPVALFIHGALLNGHVWRHQLAELSDTPVIQGVRTPHIDGHYSCIQ